MTINEFVLHQMKDTGNQIEKVMLGLEGDQWNQRSNPASLNPVEVLIHLNECLVAFESECNGEKHEWGSYQPEQTSPSGLMESYMSARKRAEQLVSVGDERVLKSASAFIVVHEAYHVGQLATLRLQLGEWDAYSIYA